MKTIIQYVNIKTSETMSLYVTKHLEKLSKKYEWVIKANVFFKHENDATEKGKICDIELSLPGPKIFATSNEKNYEMAVKETISDLEKQLEKRKAKIINH
ncbi:ribosome hibernation-promoting factor, HPF/YfiA family [Lacinutrix sp. Bg11-31]|uniref:ribosome hibernation-promoting factor, HPF/YfiA family n=1 Tax=Lacinutrix sp. Bg11-31 TaxID=2057808 RepID=UPI000C31133F|nr:ribosome-associated translation inhibitor RaiA [Lacinutrix sp. Bg11-31]AUC81125.1 ribosomal subunit interface protein [Lacinutrix sp. Bg11-31]